jgi:hypothetical protein
MKSFSAAALVFVGISALAFIVTPSSVLAQGGAMSKQRNTTSVNCKSGTVVTNKKKCKENGGKF